MNIRTMPALLTCLLFLFVAPLSAAEHRVEAIDDGPPADQLSPEIVNVLSPHGARVIRGTKRAVAEIWLAKAWDVKPDFKPTLQVLYPFKPGQFIGAIRFETKGGDFRDQTISTGVYTLRYALQPVDGNHVGTSPTSDFLLLAPAADDKSPDVLNVKELENQSKAAAESTHPAIFCMRRSESPPKSLPAMRHDEEDEWWIVQLGGTANEDDKTYALPIEFVIVGHASE